MNKEDQAKQFADNNWCENESNWGDLNSGFIAGFDAGVKHAEEWISVKDRLPQSGEAVLVIIANKYVANGYGIGAVDSSGDWNIAFDDDETAGTYLSNYVKRWKPLPPKPTEQ